MSDRELTRESILRNIPAGAEAWTEVTGLYQQSKEITIFERVYQEVLHRQCKYRLLPKFNSTGKQVLVTAPGPAKVRPGSRYSVDFAISVASDKYEFHLPLERQRRKMQAQGLDVDTKTLYGLCEAVAEHCNSIRERVRQDILKDFCAAHLDESPWPIAGQESQGYMWALSNRCGSYYQFEPTRSGKVALELLKNYKGSILTDGYSGYNRAKQKDELRVGQCWAHARREFIDRIDDFPEKARDAVQMIDELFAVEAQAANFEELRVLRKSKSKPTIDRLYNWLIQTRPQFLPGDGIVSAINYCLKFWDELTLFLNDLSLPLSNNDAERAMRHIVMGRKNFGGSKTINGADTAASIYTVIESCKKVGLQPSLYLKYLIEERWFGETPKTPLELSLEKLGTNKRVIFPNKSDWQV
jgi:transposase